jgi:tripartite-type tricarboxylate transporter receptor subunit TctC
MHRRTLLASLAPTLAAPLLLPQGARAQDAFPNRPIRIVAPYAPGGQSDTVARLLAPKMSEFLGQPMVIENRTGAGGSIGAGIVAGSPPDGYTLLLESFAFVVVPLIHKGLPFDYETAFAPIGQAVALPYVLLVKRDLPVTDLASFIAHAKAHPGVSYGTPGIGSPGHLAGVLLANRAGIRLEHVPYRGGAESARDLAGGVIDAAIGTANTFKPLVDEGRVKGIALTSAERRGSLANLPTIAESGFPGFDITSWNGLFAPAATPAPIREKLEAALRHATTDREIIARLATTGNDAITAGSAEFSDRIRRDRAMVQGLIRETGMKID